MTKNTSLTTTEYDFLETFRFDYEYQFDCGYDFLETFRFDYEYQFDCGYDFLETFRFDYEYQFNYEHDFLETTFRFDYEYEFAYEHDFLVYELVTLTARSSAIVVANSREDGHDIWPDNHSVLFYESLFYKNIRLKYWGWGKVKHFYLEYCPRSWN